MGEWDSAWKYHDTLQGTRHVFSQFLQIESEAWRHGRIDDRPHHIDLGRESSANGYVCGRTLESWVHSGIHRKLVKPSHRNEMAQQWVIPLSCQCSAGLRRICGQWELLLSAYFVIRERRDCRLANPFNGAVFWLGLRSMLKLSQECKRLDLPE